VAIDFNIHILLQLLFSPYGKTQRTLVILQVEITSSLQLSSLVLSVTTPLVAINLPDLWTRPTATTSPQGLICTLSLICAIQVQQKSVIVMTAML
jgi:hypothetical protein